METFRERTLATRYQPRQQLPDDYPDILKEYAREVLRAQPEDILTWSAAYFHKLALETDPLQPLKPPPDHYTPVVEDEEREVLRQRLTHAFAAAAESGAQSGMLPIAVVEHVLRTSFDLTPSQTLYVLTAPSVVVDTDGLVATEPLARDCAHAVQLLQVSGETFLLDSAEGDNTTVHGLNRKDVEGDFFRMFRMLDEAHTGVLPFADYCNALINAPYHLTQRDIRALCLRCQRGAKDEVNYENERAQWFDLLRLAEKFELFDLASSDEDEHAAS